MTVGLVSRVTPIFPFTKVKRNSEVCIICAESLHSSRTSSPHAAIHRSCCGQHTCCQSCLYRHIQAILEEGRTGGRRSFSCPLGCGKELTDAEIRDCFHRQHFCLWWELFGIMLYFLVFGWWVSPISLTPTCRHYRYWYYLLHSRAERRDLDRYEEWSKATAFADMTKNRGDVVRHCPAPDCGFSWVAACPEHQRSKQSLERHPGYLYYLPPDFESTPPLWIDYNATGRDGRRMVCGKCNVVFCGLCRNPWNYGKEEHDSISCQQYAEKLPTGGDVPLFFARGGPTRPCPGCEMRTTRISGCNHMTCPCGTEWCYVCGVTWSRRHYRCIDSSGG